MSASSNNQGIGFFGLLTICLIVLRLTNYIAWSWWAIFAPLWIPAALVLVIFVVFMIFYVIAHWND